MSDLDDAREREIARIRAEYARRARELPADRYSLENPAHRLIAESQDRAMAQAIERAGLLPLGDRRLLEVGCGTGRWLRYLADRGARRADLVGVDLDLDRLSIAGRTAKVLAGDASRLPFAAGIFDLVLQSTMMTSILDRAVRQAVADEMVRVLRPDGALVWYDFRVDNPRNPHVRGIPRAELRAMFPGCTLDVKRTTLAPPIARLLAPRLPALARWLDRTRWLATHDLAIIRP